MSEFARRNGEISLIFFVASNGEVVYKSIKLLKVHTKLFSSKMYEIGIGVALFTFHRIFSSIADERGRKPVARIVFPGVGHCSQGDGCA